MEIPLWLWNLLTMHWWNYILNVTPALGVAVKYQGYVFKWAHLNCRIYKSYWIRNNVRLLMECAFIVNNNLVISRHIPMIKKSNNFSRKISNLLFESFLTNTIPPSRIWSDEDRAQHCFKNKWTLEIQLLKHFLFLQRVFI